MTLGGLNVTSFLTVNNVSIQYMINREINTALQSYYTKAEMDVYLANINAGLNYVTPSHTSTSAGDGHEYEIGNVKIKTKIFYNGNGTSSQTWTFPTPFTSHCTAVATVHGTDSSGSGCDTCYCVADTTKLTVTHDYVTSNKNNYITAVVIGI